MSDRTEVDEKTYLPVVVHRFDRHPVTSEADVCLFPEIGQKSCG